MNKDTISRPLIKRKKTKIERDTSRVIARANIPGMSRIRKIINRVLGLSEEDAENLLEKINFDFVDRHKNIGLQFERHFNKVLEFMPKIESISKTKKMLIGAYFTMEYSIESAALFNPSIIPHPDQSNVPEGSLRFIMSLRATGEGHISSIVFRSGIIESDYLLHFNSISEFAETPELSHDPIYDKHSFYLKLEEMHVWDETCIRVLDQVPEAFTYRDLKISINKLYTDSNFKSSDLSIDIINWLANSNYKLKFDKKSKISERVIFPVSENESRGIEDARFVQFYNDNGEITYYATYTAYNGHTILSQLIETTDFLTFNIVTLNGAAIQNKGMALFPRKIKGKYVMLSRQDGENNYIMFSDNLYYWHKAQILQEPKETWEFIQIGNCGSPIEINEGWLVLTHGVGPMRQYCMGAILLDKENPEKVIARLKKPLLTPNEKEREGYVPNVVYSCGSMIHNNMLIIPYAMSDISSGIATVDLKSLIDSMDFCD
ncbi:glycoside hydrolase family 130 protein [Ancylomarina sp. 16SWW S1-10-2]|uniref:glycoside hydrolase family 130 protein n=1 Tax=Ancylomarina sp. 16SWW S1-10-2 TaxID=2499681 RepID=UPI0012AEAEA2|nr:glycoside hydrolase family 130 protein [Ancylomarina sp. 16SWW S1-10-2]MRT92260.1 glycosidase [Ancylomarina sp. 16SWW S1-10-2]